jgi:hypothetical protein
LVSRLCFLGAVALAAFAAAMPAAAQSGAMWTDPLGRMLTFQFAGGSVASPAPADRPAAEMARLFKSICLDGNDAAAIGSAAIAAGLAANPQTVPAGKKPPITLNLWTGSGLVVSQTDGFFAAPNAQCNTAFYVLNMPSREEVTDALAAAIGSPPSNLSAATDKSGKPRKYYAPEWRLDGADGGRIVTAFVQKGDKYMPGDRVQISIRSAKKAAN